MHRGPPAYPTASGRVWHISDVCSSHPDALSQSPPPGFPSFDPPLCDSHPGGHGSGSGARIQTQALPGTHGGTCRTSDPGRLPTPQPVCEPQTPSGKNQPCLSCPPGSHHEFIPGWTSCPGAILPLPRSLGQMLWAEEASQIGRPFLARGGYVLWRVFPSKHPPAREPAVTRLPD